jgi:hypothetical protein
MPRNDTKAAVRLFLNTKNDMFVPHWKSHKAFLLSAVSDPLRLLLVVSPEPFVSNYKDHAH